MGAFAELVTWAQRYDRLRRKLRTVTPAELKRALDAGEPVVVVDMRHPLDFLPDPRLIPGAVRISPEEIKTRHGEIPRDRDVVLYCTCPTEATSRDVAALLISRGITRVRPLKGGFQAWRAHGYPLVAGPSSSISGNSDNS